MKPEIFLENVGLVSTAANGIESLRAFIFQLAIEGKLVEQIPDEEPAEILLSKIKSEKEKLIKKGELKKSKNELDAVVPVEKLPKGWALTCLAELGLVNPRNSLTDSLEVSFIPMKLIPEGFSGVASSEVGKWKDVKGGFTHIASNDVVLAKITPCFQNRKSVVLKNLKNGFGAGTTELHVFRAFPNTAVPEYVLLFLKSANFINLGIPKMTGSAGQKRVPNDYFSLTPIPLPPREEQKRIVAKVDQLMALCDELEAKQEKQTHTRSQLNDAALNALLSAVSPDEFKKHWQRIVDNFDLLYDDLENLDSFRKAILSLAVQGKLTRSNDNSPLTASRGSNGYPFAIPSNWEWLKLGDVANKTEYGTSYKSEKENIGIPVLRMGNIQNGVIDFSNLKYVSSEIDDLPKLYLRKGDLLFNRTNSYELVGKTGIYEEEDNKYTFASYLIRIEVNVTKASGQYVNMVMNSSYYRKTQIEPDVSQQCGQANFNGTKLSNTLIPVPPLVEQKRIAGKVDQLMSLCDELEKKLTAKSAHLEKLTESLLRV